MKKRNSLARHGAVPAFLVLPTEIRCEVYRLVLTAPLLRAQDSRRSGVDKTAPELRTSGVAITELEDSTQSSASSSDCSTQVLRVCRQIYDEAFPFFYGHVTLSVEKPLDFANFFLLRLEPTKLSQLRRLRFKVGRLTPPFKNAIDHLNSFKFSQIQKVFESYAELRNLDEVVVDILPGSWVKYSQHSEFQLNAYQTATEVSLEQLSQNKADLHHPFELEYTRKLYRTIFNLAGGNLRGFKIFWKLYDVPTVTPGAPYRRERGHTITLQKER